MSYVQVANRAIEQQTGGRHRDWAQRLSRSVPRRQLPFAPVPLVTLHANSDESGELWPSSKIGKRMCPSAPFVQYYCSNSVIAQQQTLSDQSSSCGYITHPVCFYTVNRNSRQRRFNGKTAKVDWKQSIGKVLTR